RDEPLTYDIAVEKIKDVEGALLPMIKIDENLLDHGPNLKVISNFTVGYNNFDTDIMKERGIIGTNAAGSSNNTVAELIFGLIIGAARRIHELYIGVQERKWE